MLRLDLLAPPDDDDIQKLVNRRLAELAHRSRTHVGDQPNQDDSSTGALAQRDATDSHAADDPETITQLEALFTSESKPASRQQQNPTQHRTPQPRVALRREIVGGVLLLLIGSGAVLYGLLLAF